jgi:PAS domain S-box-containing protein
MKKRSAPTSKPDTQLFYDAVKASPIGIAVENLEGQILFVNPALCSMLGFSEEEFRSKHHSDFAPAEDTAKDQALFQQLQTGSIDHYQLEKRYFRRDGSLVWGSLKMSLFKTGSSSLMIAMVEDITEKKTAEEVLFRYAAIVESSDDAIASGTLNGTIVSWNTGARRMYGYTEAEAVGKPITMLVPPELPDEENKILEELRTGGRIEHFETVRVGKTGNRINVSLSISPIKDSTGKAVGCCGIARDITARKRVEDRLREYEKAVEGLEEMIVVVDRDYRYRIANRKFLNLRNMTREQVEGRFAPEVMNKGMFEAVKEKLDDSFQGKTVRFDMKYTYPKLGERDISVSYFPVEGTNGVDRVACIFQDITERKQSEQALRESEERFRLAAQAGKMYAYTWDVASDVIVRAGDVSGVIGSTGEAQLTREQLLARIHPDDRAFFTASVNERTPEHPDVQISYRLLQPDGSLVWVEKTAHALFDNDGKMVQMIGMVADITGRRQAEEAIHESEERFRLVANTAPVMIWMTGLDKKPIYFNQLWLEFTGLSEADLQNGLTGIVHPEDLQQGLNTYCQAFDQRQPFRKECRLRRHDGEYRWMLDIGVPRFHKDGSFAGYIGSCVDVTDRKLAEEALADISRKLLQAQERERSRIARELHDDINQRLAMLAVELEQLQNHPSEVESRVQGLRRHITEISDGVQALSHDLHSAQLEYLGVVAGTKGWCREFGERQGLQIDCRHDVRSTVPTEIGLCLFRVLQEALHNAAKHSGVKRIEVQLHEESGEIHLIVRDLGKGFDMESTRQGRGLGLTSMQERVRLVNGTIDIQSGPMGGTMIAVRVPIVPKCSPQAAAPSQRGIAKTTTPVRSTTS